MIIKYRIFLKYMRTCMRCYSFFPQIQFFSPPKCSFICNTPGFGKTRWTLECLAAYWGLYFVTALDSGRVGVADLSRTMDLICQHPEWKTDLSFVPFRERSSQHDRNHRIATNHLMKLLIAPMLVFEMFLQEAIQLDGKLEDGHRYSWLLFQLF